MKNDPHVRLRRALLVLCALAAVWAVVISLTGGFRVRIGSIRLSSRTPLNSLLIALAAGLAAGALSWRDWRRTLREDWRWFRLVAAAVRYQWRWLQPAGIAVALAIAGAAVIARQWWIARPLFVDEEMIALNVRDRSVAELAGPLWYAQSAPYGWLALQRAAVLAFGTSEHAVRLIPALFGIATLGAALWIGRRWMTPFGAAILMLLCAVGLWLSFYAVVVKHYSADVFGALLVPALGAWVVDGHARDRYQQTRRAALWWAVSALSQWFANGALLVTPACATVLTLIVWRRQGWKAARTFALFGFLWVACFGLHYVVSIRHTAVNNAYLQAYWAEAMPPASAGIGSKLTWLARQLGPLAENPGGATLSMSFWLCAAAGFALTWRSPLTVLFATVPLSAFSLAAIRIVPLYQRLSLWIVPAIYVGIALLGDQVSRTARNAFVQRRWIRFAAALPVALIVVHLCVDIFRRGASDIRYGRPPDHNQLLDDRSAVRWLMRYARPGDAIIATPLAVPAVFWYGAIPMSERDGAHGGRRVFEAEYRPDGCDSRPDQLREALRGRTRALVYLGFRFDMPDEFDELLMRSLGELGRVSAYSEFSQESRAAVVDLDRPGSAAANPTVNARGCIAVQPAGRW